MSTVRIQTYADGSFQRADTGPKAVLCPVRMDDGEIIDSVAWFADRPGVWWLEHLVATHLGDRALRRAAFLGEPIRLVPSPAAWLSETAVCVLDWTTDLRALFREVAEIRCSSPALAKHLSQCLDRQVRHGFKIKVAS